MMRRETPDLLSICKIPSLWAILLYSTLLVSCGDNNTVSLAPPVPEINSPSGVWAGSFTSTRNGAIRQVTGVVSESYDTQLVTTAIGERHYSGIVSTDGDTLTGTLTTYLGRKGPFLGFDGVQSIMLDGTIVERSTMSGDYTGNEDDGRFNLNYSNIYENGSSLDSTSGIWVYSEASSGGALYTVTLDIDANGTLFGTDTGGCVYGGQLALIDDRFNSYQANFNVSSCITKNGDYSGLAFLSSIGGGQINQLVLGASKPNRAFAALLRKL